ncbi:MAG: hypothetical protein AAFO01_13655, partial [Pseudomonadota bacterium]
SGPFQVEMLSVFLIRAFVVDLVEHLAKAKSPEKAVTLAPASRRRFGIGNSTGLGMAPFLVSHPVLISHWIEAREQALSRVRSLARATEHERAIFRVIVARARLNAETWTSDHEQQRDKLTRLREDLARLERHIFEGSLEGDAPWDRLYLWAENSLSIEGQEQLVSLMLEPYGDLVDDLADEMAADEDHSFYINGAMSLDRLHAVLDEIYGWALAIDWTSQDSLARVWYTSAEKLEPRLGERFEEPIEAYEQPLAPARDAAAMAHDINKWEGEPCVAAFLLAHPEHRHTVRRVQIAARYPYAEIRDNTIANTLQPIDLLRCKLSFFGAGHFDPRSDRWVRINLFKGAPFPNDLAESDSDDWCYPPLTGSDSCTSR